MLPCCWSWPSGNQKLRNKIEVTIDHLSADMKMECQTDSLLMVVIIVSNVLTFLTDGDDNNNEDKNGNGRDWTTMMVMKMMTMMMVKAMALRMTIRVTERGLKGLDRGNHLSNLPSVEEAK
jgi:hypothetical protein